MQTMPPDPPRGKLFIIPSTLGPDAPLETIPTQTLCILRRLDHLIVESPKQARRFLQQCGIRLSTRAIKFYVLDEHTLDTDLPALLAPLIAGQDAGVLSDAGCPGVADPGARLARLAHDEQIDVMPLVGPSSILLALMASGLNGQQFAFHGYLPVEGAARSAAIASIEKQVRMRNETQIFIETPYRNNQMLAALTQTCAPDTVLCIAVDLTLPTQFVRSAPIRQWRTSMPDLNRRPAVFLLGRAVAR